MIDYCQNPTWGRRGTRTCDVQLGSNLEDRAFSLTKWRRFTDIWLSVFEVCEKSPETRAMLQAGGEQAPAVTHVAPPDVLRHGADGGIGLYIRV